MRNVCTADGTKRNVLPSKSKLENFPVQTISIIIGDTIINMAQFTGSNDFSPFD